MTTTTAPNPLQLLTDRLAVQDTVTRMSWLLDRRDWTALTGLFAEEVLLDYTQPFGGEPETLTGAELVQRWRTQVGHLDSTQHVTTGILVDLDGDRARVTANVLAHLRREGTLGSPVWHNGGHYDVRLRRAADGWRIHALRAEVSWAEGNSAVLQAP
ncbi:nuclear transport factor 2 family protein [Kineococcus sp. SYSU DK002]|uniref:nuclear transport factor 2 family protein n=1 Tax=Kineococcus sp. SYSU DK002 TaxID=3383123 RepID=UPI003D7C4B17